MRYLTIAQNSIIITFLRDGLLERNGLNHYPQCKAKVELKGFIKKTSRN